MKKFYSLKSILLGAALTLTGLTAFGQTKTITINHTSIGGKPVLGTVAYNNGAEKSWSQDNVDFGGVYITGNGNNTPAGESADTLIQTQANTAKIYNKIALPGKIISVTINMKGTARNSVLQLGSVANPTEVTLPESNTGWTSTDLEGHDFKFFSINRKANAAYFESIVITYEAQCPTITSQPVSTSVAPNAAAEFSVTAQGYLMGETLNYQWEESTDAGTTFKAINGATNATYDIATATLEMNGYQYRVIVSNETCTVASDVATLTVDPALAVGNINGKKVNLVANTVVSNELLFSAKADVTIVNMNGQVVKTANVTEGTRLNVANLTKGMYVVTAVVNGKAVSQKIIKK